MATTYVIISWDYLGWTGTLVLFRTASEKFINPAVYLILGYNLLTHLGDFFSHNIHIDLFVPHLDDIVIDTPLDVVDRSSLERKIIFAATC